MRIAREIARATAEITESDLKELLHGSFDRIRNHFVTGAGAKWKNLYDIENPLAVALCQGAAMHYYDKSSGVKDFDVWFFYPFNSKHLPYRTIWHWDYVNPKFGRHPQILGYKGRKVDVIVRSIRNHVVGAPGRTIHQYLERENSSSAKELAKKAVVLLYPEENLVDCRRGNVLMADAA